MYIRILLIKNVGMENAMTTMATQNMYNVICRKKSTAAFRISTHQLTRLDILEKFSVIYTRYLNINFFIN